jgi:hypothetical protein
MSACAIPLSLFAGLRHPMIMQPNGEAAMQSSIVSELDLAPTSKRQIITAAFASILGFALDLFDLYLLLYVAPVIGKLFSHQNHQRCR